MSTRRSGPPVGSAAAELIESGFTVENADAPFLHDGFNLADLAHVLDLLRRRIIPPSAAYQLLALLLEVHAMPAAEFPYDPCFGEPYNSREHFFVSRLGDVAGWLHAGRPRREAARIALRLYLRDQLLDLVAEANRFAGECADQASAHLRTLMPDQTYLQQAQPSTFGHYLLSFSYPASRDASRLLDAFDWVNRSPGGAGCVNGTRLLDDRGYLAAELGFDEVIEHTRDAMWQVDGLIHILATVASLISTQSKLAEDLEIWSSAEFDFVDLDDAYTRASILMPQKRNPYSLSIVRGASGVLIGRLSGFLAVSKSPSARSDNLIFAYGEVPRALDLSIRVTRLMCGVIRTLRVNAKRMAEVLDAGYTQATDLAEFIVQTCAIDYRSAYLVVGKAVREAGRLGIPARQISGRLLDGIAVAETGHSWGLAELDLSDVLDPERIVATRAATGGAAPDAVAAMIARCRADADTLSARINAHHTRLRHARETLLDRVRQTLIETPGGRH